MNTGWIKLHRQLLDWEWADNPQMVALWVHLILAAAYEETQWHGLTIMPGQIVTCYAQLQAATGLTEKQIRICFTRLEESGQITTERAGKRQVVTICNFATYQAQDDAQWQENGTQRAEKRQEKGAQKADKRQTNGAQKADKGHAINKEDKKVRSKEGKNINNPLTPLQGASPEKTAADVAVEVAPPPETDRKCHAVTQYDRLFEQEYLQLTGNVFHWTRRENIGVQSIVGKISKMMEDAGRNPTADDKEAALRWFLKSLWQTGDEWIRANFVPHVISDKFNEYYNTIKLNHNDRTKNQSNPTGVGADYLQRLASELA